MNGRIVFFLCILKHVVSDAPSPRGYYGEHFLDFFARMRKDNVFLSTMFNNLDVIKNSSELCYHHLQTYRNSLSNNTFWAMNYFDSSGGNLEPGWLTGNTVNLGAFDECVSQKSNEGFPMNYCWLNIQLEGDEQTKLWYTTKPNPLVFSLCVPRSCSYEDIYFLNKPLQKDLNFSLELLCQTARPLMTTTDYVSLCFFILVALFTISTILPEDWMPTKNNRFTDFWRCFDFYGNLRTLSSSGKDENTLKSLYGIRFLSQCCIVWAHVVFLNKFSLNPFQNKFHLFHELNKEWTGALQGELNLAVDTFLLVGGTVISYNCLKRKTKLALLKYYIHRFLRLTPALLAVVLFTATFYNKLCSGPLCMIYCDIEGSQCTQYWWSFFLYISNYFPTCLGHTWYLAADWQLFMFVSPFVVTVINKMPQHTYKLIVLILLMSIAYSASLSVILDFPIGIFKSDVEHETYMLYYYKTPFLRAGPWAIGLFLGVFINDYHNKPKSLSKLTLFFCWILCAVFLVFCTSYFRILSSSYPSWWARAAFYTFNSNLFVLAVAWIVFACSTNNAGPIGKILTAPAFEPLGKLSYSMYLLHIPILYIYIGDIRTPSFYSAAQQAPVVFGLIVVSTFAALLLYLTFEAPFMHIDRLIFRKDNTRKEDLAVRKTSSTKMIFEYKKNYNSCQD